jgi:hypothetical protein
MSRKLIIHQPTNHQSKTFRYYNIFFDNLIEELSKQHEVVVDRYYKDAHLGHSPIKLGWEDEISEILMYECEMIIEDFNTKETIVLGVADDLTSTTLNLQSSPNLTKVFISQFIRDKVYHHVKPEYQSKYHPWIYFPSNKYDLDFFYNKRKEMTQTNNKMFFRGETSSRTILNHFNVDVIYGGTPIGGFEKYATEMLDFKLALSIAGRGEMCYRDVECMAMGIPFIRFEYTTELNPPLIPNFHYVSVDRPDDLKNWMRLDRTGEHHHAEMITKRYLEVINNQEFLDFVSTNAREYYENYLSPTSSIEHTIKLLNL